MCSPEQNWIYLYMNEKNKRKAVGYIRLSTEKQAHGDTAFIRQAERIRRTCDRHGFDLLRIWEDVASAASPNSLRAREGLRNALAAAIQEDAILIITEPTRLFRHAADGAAWLKTNTVPVFSVEHGRIVGKRALITAFREGEAFADNARAGTSEAMKRVAATSDNAQRMSNIKNGRKSAETRRDKAQGNVFKVAQILRTIPDTRLTHEELAQLLNRKGILTTRGDPFTKQTVRRVRKAAEEKNREDDAFDAEEDDFFGAGEDLRLEGARPARTVMVGKEVSDGVLDTSGRPPAVDDTQPAMSDHERKLREDMTEEEWIQLSSHPMFGMF
jgi:hypothetical protein